MGSVLSVSGFPVRPATCCFVLLRQTRVSERESFVAQLWQRLSRNSCGVTRALFESVSTDPHYWRNRFLPFRLPWNVVSSLSRVTFISLRVSQSLVMEVDARYHSKA